MLLTSETLTAVLVGTDDIKLEDRDAFDLVTDLANLANLLKPSNNKLKQVTEMELMS